MKPRRSAIWIFLLAALTATVARAHDPYEITATASVLKDRFEVSAILEYRAARLLAGLGWPTNQIDEAAEFIALKPTLEKVAGNFFQVAASGENLPVNSVAIQLGVENHVTLTLSYPAVGQKTLTVAAPGLAALAPEGQYGVGLTVLDMVQKKVLGQHVFNAENPRAQATFAPLAEDIVAEPKIRETGAVVLVSSKSDDQTGLPKSETLPAKNNPLVWPWFVAAALGIGYLWWLNRRC